jgi:hypothetical protein
MSKRQQVRADLTVHGRLSTLDSDTECLTRSSQASQTNSKKIGESEPCAGGWGDRGRDGARREGTFGAETLMD